jgi:hypothetical protein
LVLKKLRFGPVLLIGLKNKYHLMFGPMDSIELLATLKRMKYTLLALVALKQQTPDLY